MKNVKSDACCLVSKVVFTILLIFALSSCEKKPRSPEVANCLKNFKELNPEECVLLTSVGEYKMEFPLRFAPSFLNNRIGVRINYPADNRLFKHITTKNFEGEFLQADDVHFNRASIDNIIASDAKFKSLRNASYIAIKKSKASIPYSNIIFNNEMTVVDGFRECNSSIKTDTEIYKFDNKELSSRQFDIRYSGKIGDVCSVRIRALLEEDVYIQMDVGIPVTKSGKSIDDWIEPIDWADFFSSLDDFLTEITIE